MTEQLVDAITVGREEFSVNSAAQLRLDDEETRIGEKTLRRLVDAVVEMIQFSFSPWISPFMVEQKNARQLKRSRQVSTPLAKVAAFFRSTIPSLGGYNFPFARAATGWRVRNGIGKVHLSTSKTSRVTLTLC